MKLNKLALIAAIACGLNTAAIGFASANEIQQVSCFDQSCDCGQPVCGCESVECEDPCCDTACDPGCGCEDPSCDTSCCDSGCDSGCGAGCGLLGGGGGCLPGITGDCDLGDPCKLFGECNGIDIGGWTQLGYHTKADSLFNNRPDELQLHQAWLYAQKTIDTADGFDLGGRFDYVYGTDGPNTQAFGISNDHWDNDWDNGPDNSGYGHAIPQLYAEAGYGDLSVKIGHFFTPIGWEVVGATGNFFYSHAYTMNNSEPFTHTGALATYAASDDLTLYGGYVMGWDSGFEDNGDAFLGGASLAATEDLTLIYMTVAGRFDDGDIGRNGGEGENGYMQSVIANYSVSEKMQYIFQTDYLDTDRSTVEAVNRRTSGINQYLIYTINDCLSAGTRFEWYDVTAGQYSGQNDIYAWTAGLNYKPHANVLVRPEIRNDWVFGDPTGILENSEDEQFTFGIDTIFLF